MDKKEQKEQLSMEEKKNQNDKSKSIHDILPLDLIQRILLRVRVKHLGRLKCVSKLWHSLISDPNFAELHFHHSPVSTNACISIGKLPMAYSVYLDALFSDGNDALQVREVSPPFDMTRSSDVKVIGSCRGFVLFDRHPCLLVVWNPLTGSRKLISYSHILSRCKHKDFSRPSKFHLYGFGYDASQDDYLVVVAWQDMDDHDHFDCFSLRTNSWIDFDAALPNPLFGFDRNSFGLFLNDAIHWVQFSPKVYRDAILIFDMKERTFSRISAPEQLVMFSRGYSGLALLGGCLALYYRDFNSCSTHIWVMKEYKVHSSWTLYQVPCKVFQPLCFSSNGDIIGRDYTKRGGLAFYYHNRDSCNTDLWVMQEYKVHSSWTLYQIPCKVENGDIIGRGYNFLYMYNLREEECFKNHWLSVGLFASDAVYTESLLPLPSDINDKDNNNNKKKKEKVDQVHHECFEQLDVAKG
ncbi:F-box protein CPR30-like isoform X1 [Arachis ipaensis]|uniref:F-box protein CPR1 n=2 Tax=Arachis TaxID=3817 RepID=UPI000A2B7607|nr:F-box protein CPR30-like isoform X1 [Arachis ipaensis]XP_016196310.2 F-box protein CPR30-like isoform X1 [Arachis ipaensis]XP_029152661.1 F-box protein CPR1-like [Arachis hypogaea]